MVRIRLVGRPRLEIDGVAVAGPRGRKSWALLGRLVRSSQPVSRQVLVDELFSEADDPLSALRWSMAELRRRIGGLTLQGNPVELRLGGEVTVDVVDLASGQVPTEIPEGDFLEGIDVAASPGFEAWLLVERQRVDGEVLSVLRQAALRALSGRESDRAVALGGAMVRRAPFEEGSHIMLIQALAASGDTQAALEQADASAAMLSRELGALPSPAVHAAARPRASAPVPAVAPRASANALLDAGLAALSAGAPDAGIECLRGASGAAERAGDRELLSRCLTELGTALVHAIRGYDDEGSMVLDRAAELASSVGAQATSAKALTELAYVDVLAGRRESAVRSLGRAREMAENEPALLAAIAGIDAMNLSDWGRLEAGAARFAEAVELSRSAGSARREVWSRGLGARTLVLQGRLDDAMDWATDSLELARREQWTAFRPWPEAWLAQARLSGGVDPRVVRGEAEAAFALARQLEDPCWEGVSAKVIGMTHLAEAEYAEALAWLTNAGALSRRVTDSYAWLDVDILVAEAETAHASGDRARAEAIASRAVADAAKRGMDGHLGRALLLVGGPQRRRGQRREGQAGGANNSRAMPSGSRNESPDP